MPKRLPMASSGYVYHVLNRAVARRFGWHEGERLAVVGACVCKTRRRNAIKVGAHVDWRAGLAGWQCGHSHWRAGLARCLAAWLTPSAKWRPSMAKMRVFLGNLDPSRQFTWRAEGGGAM